MVGIEPLLKLWTNDQTKNKKKKGVPYRGVISNFILKLEETIN